MIFSNKFLFILETVFSYSKVKGSNPATGEKWRRKNFQQKANNKWGSGPNQGDQIGQFFTN
jgi:hypothetical protein